MLGKKYFSISLIALLFTTLALSFTGCDSSSPSITYRIETVVVTRATYDWVIENTHLDVPNILAGVRARPETQQHSTLTRQSLDDVLVLVQGISFTQEQVNVIMTGIEHRGFHWVAFPNIVGGFTLLTINVE